MFFVELRGWVIVLAVLFTAPVAVAQEAADGGDTPSGSADEFLRRTRAFMTLMAAGNARDARRIADAYARRAAIHRYRNRESLAAAIRTGDLRELPEGAASVRIRPRTAGMHPIGEMDLPHQRLYLTAHPAAIECLMRIATSLPSGSLEVTSLVRHGEYQERLARTNVNASRRGSIHALGLAFDISVLNVPSSTAVAIGQVLLQMREAGDLYFVAETRQLVFHVVPAASRLDTWKQVVASTDTAGEPPRIAKPLRVLAAAPVPSPWLLETEIAASAPAFQAWTALLGAVLFVVGAVVRRARMIFRC